MLIVFDFAFLVVMLMLFVVIFTFFVVVIMLVFFLHAFYDLFFLNCTA